MSNDDQTIDEPDRLPVDILPLLDDVAIFKQAGGLLIPRRFIEVCKDHGLDVSEQELEFYESKGLLYPLLRIPCSVQWYDSQGQPVNAPDDDSVMAGMSAQYVSYTTQPENLLLLHDEGLLIQPDAQTFRPWHEYRSPAAPYQLTTDTYYVLYQILHIYWLKRHLILRETYHRGAEQGDRPIRSVQVLSNRLPSGEQLQREIRDLDRLVAFLLAIQNRYRPMAIGILSGYFDRAQYRTYAETFSPEVTWGKVPIPLDQLRTERWFLCNRARDIDPLVKWHLLMKYISPFKRRELRGMALLAQGFYAIVDMISYFLDDLAKQRGATEPPYTCIGDEHYERQMYGRKLNFLDIDVLDHILTEYDLNPRPRILWIVEGATEETAIPIICDALGVRLAAFGIEPYNIAGAGKRKHLELLANYIASPRLGPALAPGVYAMTRQTRIFVLMDREQGWEKDSKVRGFLSNLKDAIIRLLPDDMPETDRERIATLAVTFKPWDMCFEFDNFSDEELAEAISTYARKWGWPEIDASDVAACRVRFPKCSLTKIIKDKARTMKASGQDVVEHRNYEWGKVEVGRLLAADLTGRLVRQGEGKSSAAKIVAIIDEVIALAQENWP